MSDEQGTEYELAMPMMLVQSQGGPFDDAAFVAGYTCGTIDQELFLASALNAAPTARYVNAQYLTQIDLIAMRHQYTLELGELDEASGWQMVAFSRA
ncbi:hypothetical protein AB0J13_10965 [Streptomyces anulatus]|uniref:hypothetical protein n=1 Tax=Streptomyces anulatus TaxID=1892 RepID=UPI0033D47AE3